MADFRPFRAVRYDERAVGALDLVVAPPYDVIAEGLRDRLYSVSPRNIVRIESPRRDAADPEGCYYRAARDLAAWRREAVMVQDDSAAYFVHRMAWPRGPGIRPGSLIGVTGILRAEPYGSGQVFPHEATLPEPRRDRLNLLKATRMQASPVYCVYRDPDGVVERWVEPLIRGAPLARATTPDNVVHEVWRVSDPAAVEAIRSTLRLVRVVIADGHHRYETARTYARATGTERAAFVLATLVNVALQHPVILPTHRMVRLEGGCDGAPGTWLRCRLSQRFAISGWCGSAEDPDALDPAAVPGDGAARGDAETAFGVVTVGESGPDLFSATLRRDARPLLGEGPLAHVDAFVFHKALMPLVFEDPEQAVRQGLVDFTRDEAELRRLVADGTFAAGFLLRACTAEQVMTCALAGERMPQKSTYFYPKLPSGLLCYSLE